MEKEKKRFGLVLIWSIGEEVKRSPANDGTGIADRSDVSRRTKGGRSGRNNNKKKKRETLRAAGKLSSILTEERENLRWGRYVQGSNVSGGDDKIEWDNALRGRMTE
jgi:hypothetical protein